eukprot:scaffold2036_cov256-Pinguiococcus_pyrenoidosus.AAC.14
MARTRVLVLVLVLVLGAGELLWTWCEAQGTRRRGDSVSPPCLCRKRLLLVSRMQSYGACKVMVDARSWWMRHYGGRQLTWAKEMTS